MKKEYRIKKQNEINAVFKTNKKVHGKHLSIFYELTDEDHFRFAISIGKKYGNAVKRNLAKRRIRSLFRELQDQIPTYLMVITVKPSVHDVSFKELKKDFLKLLNKIK